MEINCLLIALLLIIVLSMICYAFKKYVSKDVVYDFQNWEKTDMPYIHLEIQGHIFNMIADSGASISIIHRDALQDLQVEKSLRVVNLTAIDDEGMPSEVVTIPININGKEVKVDFVVYDTPVGDFVSQCGVTMHGILGVEFFRKTRGKVDFKKKTVTFS